MNVFLSNALFRQVLFAALLTLFCPPLLADEEDESDDAAAHTLLTEVVDLQALGQRARAVGVPILLMFASEDCHYCERLEAEVLGPMKFAGEDPQRVLLRKIMLETPRPLRDFQGREVEAGELAAAYRADVVPTLYLLDAEGRALVPKIVGYTSPDFYPAYLDQAIDVARTLMRRAAVIE